MTSEPNPNQVERGKKIIANPAMRASVLAAIALALGNAAPQVVPPIAGPDGVPHADVRVVCSAVANAVGAITDIAKRVPVRKVQEELVAVGPGTLEKPGTLLTAFMAGACKEADSDAP